MIAFLRNWLTGMICTAAIVALAQALTPKGTVKKIGTMIGGLVLMCVMLKPVLGFDFSAFSAAMSQYRLEAEEASLALTEENLSQMKDLIAGETEAYIADKAEALGAAAEGAVRCEVNGDGLPYPAEATVFGNLTEGQKREIQSGLESEFGIPAEHQSFLPKRGETG